MSPKLLTLHQPQHPNVVDAPQPEVPRIRGPPRKSTRVVRGRGKLKQTAVKPQRGRPRKDSRGTQYQEEDEEEQEPDSQAEVDEFKDAVGSPPRQTPARGNQRAKQTRLIDDPFRDLDSIEVLERPAHVPDAPFPRAAVTETNNQRQPQRRATAPSYPPPPSCSVDALRVEVHPQSTTDVGGTAGVTARNTMTSGNVATASLQTSYYTQQRGANWPAVMTQTYSAQQSRATTATDNPSQHMQLYPGYPVQQSTSSAEEPPSRLPYPTRFNPAVPHSSDTHLRACRYNINSRHIHQ